jgi:hypothetical protein
MVNCGTAISYTTRDFTDAVYAIAGWLEPLLDRIAVDSTTVVCPVIDVIDDDTLEYHYRDSSGVNVGGFDWNLQVRNRGRTRRRSERAKQQFGDQLRGSSC